MTTFTDTWNGTYESLPPDTVEAGSQGASRIRSFKLAMRERIAVDHSIAGDSHDGKHVGVTLRVQGGDPTLDTGDGRIYTKAVGATNEPHFKDNNAVVRRVAIFASGTRMLFQQTAAPTGWTKETSATYNDAALRFQTGTVTTGGADAFSTHFGTGKVTGTGTSGGFTLTTAEIPSHTHQETFVNDGASEVAAFRNTTGSASVEQGPGSTTCPGSPQGATPVNVNTQATGGGGSHSHSVPALSLPNFNIKFADCIIAAKD